MTLTSVTSSAWSVLDGSNGAVTLDNANLSVVGDDVSVTMPYPTDDQVSFYGPGGAYATDSVTAVSDVVIVNHAAVTLNGADDAVYLGGDDDVLNLTGGNNADWSTVYAANGVVNLTLSSLSVVGGGVNVNMLTGGEVVSLYRTDDDAASLTGNDDRVILNTAEVKIVGKGDAVWATGATDVSFADDAAIFDQADDLTVHGADDAISFEGGATAVNLEGGGDDALIFSPAFGDDVVYGANPSDRVMFADFGDLSAVAAAATQQGADTVVRYDATDIVTFKNVSRSEFLTFTFKTP